MSVFPLSQSPLKEKMFSVAYLSAVMLFESLARLLLLARQGHDGDNGVVAAAGLW